MYRVLCRVFAGGFLLLTGAAAAFAEPDTAGQLALRAEQLETVERGSAFSNTLDAHIAAARADAEGRDVAWLAQLRSFYISRDGAPVWVSSKGWTSRARSAIAELSKAGDWGLDPAAFQAPEINPNDLTDDALASAELGLSRAVVKYAFHAHGGRIDPSSLSLWLNRTDDPVYATAVMIDVVSNEDAGAALRAMHPPYPEFELLRKAYVAMRREIEHPREPDPADIMAMGPTIKLGEWHPDVLVVRRKLKVPAEEGFQSKFDEKLANALHDYLSEQKVRVRWGRIDDKARRVLNRPSPPPKKEDLDRLLANMERWRWLPRDLGAFHIWNNLPEMETRVVENGKVIHEERIIVGQPDTQTPVFSERMRQIVFQPEWGVPPSIKVNDLLPKLKAGDYGVLERRNMRILGLSGRELRPTRFKWNKIDIRDVGIYQRSGSGNPLGRVKFLFPNEHHVYMHDTNNRALFTSSRRLYSHGCVRVRNPERLAVLLLARDKGWSEDTVNKLLSNSKKPSNKINLDRPFMVHNVYFTMVPGEDRTIVKYDDMYGHDRRVIQALSGVPASKIAAADPARSQLREIDEAVPESYKRSTRERRARNDD